MKSNMSSDIRENFDPEIREIEKEIANFFAETGAAFVGRHPHVSTILVYFYLRKKLTQKDLQALTGLSAGSVSKAVRQLVKMNIISQETIAGTHTYIYCMEKVPFVSPRFFFATGKFIGNIEKELKDMKKTLDDNLQEMKDLEGYDRIYGTITQILRLLPLTEAFMTKLEEQLKVQ